LAGILGSPPAAPLLDEVLARSDGNPLFAEELLAAGGSQELSTTLHDLLTGRVDALSGPARQVLGVAAVAGRRVGHGLLAAACPLQEQGLLAAVRETVEHQVLVADSGGDAYWFRHALLQELVEADLLPGERRRLHAALAQVLSARPELAGGTPAQTAAEVAVHWDQGHELARALPAALAAGVAAAHSLAFAETQRHFERALELWDQVPEVAAGLPLDRAGLLERAAEAAHLAGDQQHAVALMRAALASVDGAAEPVRAGLLAARLGSYLVWSSDEALGAYQQAVDLVPAEPPTAARARVLAGQAHVLMMASRMREARARAEEALAVARLAGARREQGWALLTLGSAMDWGEPEEPLTLLREARKIAEELGDGGLLSETFIYRPQIQVAAGRLVDALAELLEGLETSRRLGLEHPGAFLSGFAGALCFRLGRWQDANLYSRQAVAATPMPAMPALHARMWQAKFQIERGEFAAAVQRLDELTRPSLNRHGPSSPTTTRPGPHWPSGKASSTTPAPPSRRACNGWPVWRKRSCTFAPY
jgi:tetratricopeptide (TPR) repeat protein